MSKNGLLMCILICIYLAKDCETGICIAMNAFAGGFVFAMTVETAGYLVECYIQSSHFAFMVTQMYITGLHVYTYITVTTIYRFKYGTCLVT